MAHKAGALRKFEVLKLAANYGMFFACITQATMVSKRGIIKTQANGHDLMVLEEPPGVSVKPHCHLVMRCNFQATLNTDGLLKMTLSVTRSH